MPRAFGIFDGPKFALLSLNFCGSGVWGVFALLSFFLGAKNITGILSVFLDLPDLLDDLGRFGRNHISEKLDPPHKGRVGVESPAEKTLIVSSRARGDDEKRAVGQVEIADK